jgi:hypothetical protein
VDDAVQRVVILGIFQAGRNYESVLADPDGDHRNSPT